MPICYMTPLFMYDVPMIILQGIAFGAAAGSAFAAFVAVKAVLEWLAMIFKMKCESKVLKAIGVQMPENGGDFTQPDTTYQPQSWRK